MEDVLDTRVRRLEKRPDRFERLEKRIEERFAQLEQKLEKGLM